MRIFSEKTGKEYETIEECQKEEIAYDKAKAAAEVEKTKLAKNRKIRAKEVEDAFRAIKDAEKRYIKLRNNFVNDYGSFHMTFSNIDQGFENLFDGFFSFL